MERLRLVVVLAIVFTAGCSGLTGGTESTDRDPYGVEDPVEASILDLDAVPGLTEDGFQDASFLDAHEAALANRSYTQYTVENSTTSDGTLLQERGQAHAVDPDRGASYSVTEIRGSSVPIVDGDEEAVVERWSEDGQVLEQIAVENRSVRYEEGRHTVGSLDLFQFAPALVEAEETTIEQNDGRTVVTGTEPAANSQYVADEPFEVEAVIREDGVVERVSLEGTVRNNNQLIHQELEFRIADVGETTVERPSWYDEAVAELDDEDA